jgi:hypothetical protein
MVEIQQARRSLNLSKTATTVPQLKPDTSKLGLPLNARRVSLNLTMPLNARRVALILTNLTAAPADPYPLG